VCDKLLHIIHWFCEDEHRDRRYQQKEATDIFKVLSANRPSPPPPPDVRSDVTILECKTDAAFTSVRFAMRKIKSQEEKSFNQQIGLRFKKETTEMLHLELSFVWC